MKTTTNMTPAQKNEAARLYDLGYSPAEAFYRTGVTPPPAVQTGSLYSNERLSYVAQP